MVPNLRFKDFSLPWHKTAIIDLLSFQNGINGTPEQYGKGIKYISVGDILNNDYITYDKIVGSIDISQETLKNYSVTYGDILFQRSSEIKEDIGRTNVYLDKDNKATFGGFVIRGKKIGDYNPAFFNVLLKSPSSRKSIVRLGAGAQHYNIGQENIKTLSFYFPDEEEQAKIANLFSKIDKRIQTQIKIINDYKSLKKWINDKIYSDLKCEYLSFSSVYVIAKEGGTPSTTKPEYYSGNIPFIKIDDLNKKYITENKVNISEQGLSNSSAWIIPKNSVIMSNGATIGNVSINTYPVSTKQGILGIVPKDDVLTEYLYYLLNTTDFRRNLKQVTTKGTIDCAYIKDIDHIKVKIPELEIQKSIIQILKRIDKKIELEVLILDFINKQKQYLLNNLFV